jgi:hypothetical protein
MVARRASMHDRANVACARVWLPIKPCLRSELGSLSVGWVSLLFFFFFFVFFFFFFFFFLLVQRRNTRPAGVMTRRRICAMKWIVVKRCLLAQQIIRALPRPRMRSCGDLTWSGPRPNAQPCPVAIGGAPKSQCVEIAFESRFDEEVTLSSARLARHRQAALPQAGRGGAV